MGKQEGLFINLPLTLSALDRLDKRELMRVCRLRLKSAWGYLPRVEVPHDCEVMEAKERFRQGGQDRPIPRRPVIAHDCVPFRSGDEATSGFLLRFLRPHRLEWKKLVDGSGIF